MTQKRVNTPTHVVDTTSLCGEFLHSLFSLARQFLQQLREQQPLPQSLTGRRIILAFFERSTRTRISFELAAKQLGAITVNFDADISSIGKGESLIDTFRTLEAMHVDAFIVRHPLSGVAHFLAKNLRTPVINAGDGLYHHPTQALLDAFTLWDRLGALEGKRICIIGDIAHSRVARSSIPVYKQLQMEVALCAPPPFLPLHIEGAFHVHVFPHLEEALLWADILSVLRVQRERITNPSYSVDHYVRWFQVQLKHVQRHSLLAILHPGPVNWGIELDPALADHPNLFVLSQVEHGIAIRSALLHLLLGSS